MYIERQNKTGLQTTDQQITKQPTFGESLMPPILFVLFIAAIEIVQSLSGTRLADWGLYPRKLSGLIGVITSPLLHSGYPHLFSNSVPFIVLGTITLFFYRKVAGPVFFIIYVLTGISVWLMARPSYHIGLSGVVYGLVSFVFWVGVFRRDRISIVLALVVTILYSGMFLGISPDQEGISWEGHLMGAFSGIYAAFLFRNQIEALDKERYSWEEEEVKTTYYLPRDTFEKTLQQRREEQNRQIPDLPYWTSTKDWDV